MEQIHWDLVRGRILQSNLQKTVYCCPTEGLRLEVSGTPGAPFCGKDWTRRRALVMGFEVLAEDTARFHLHFWRKENLTEEADMRVEFSLLPHIRTIVPIDFDLLDSQVIFPNRPAGVLKFCVVGKPLDRTAVDRIVLETVPCFEERQIVMKAAYLTDDIPNIPSEKRPLMDELGQWMPKDWPGKLKSREECTRHLLDLREWSHRQLQPVDRYGGWNDRRFEATGWFRTQFDGARWWLVTPDGKAFFSTGVDCINPGSETSPDGMESFLPVEEERPADWNYGVRNMEKAYGKESWWEDWAEITANKLRDWGFNTIGNWSQTEFFRHARMPYVIPLDVYSDVGFPGTATCIFRDFPDVFSEEYESNARSYAEALRGFQDDPLLVGYFMCNEPAWGFVYHLNIAEEMLARPERFASKSVFVEWIRQKYTSVAVLNRAWQSDFKDFEELFLPVFRASERSEEAANDLREFSRRMVTRYVELPAKLCREVDPHHLNLGMRYAYISDPVLLAGCENFDVFSINCYQEDPLAKIEAVAQQLNMPVMIGEFHFGALDRGLPSTGIRGVSSQKQRGIAYRYYLEQGMRCPYFVGAHYFQYNDQSCLGRSDGENGQIGLMDICMQEYHEMLGDVKQCHAELYAVCSGQQPAAAERPDSIPTHY